MPEELLEITEQPGAEVVQTTEVKTSPKLPKTTKEKNESLEERYYLKLGEAANAY